ncbi:hypothetical protein Acr_11g0012920 [Actinidia rufa]|uniref:C3H1-type domain-containing protein n=1 Tax=Actinidia rufa TaxID=165716 RepID=A0A7J0FEW8_9ERIC|nr:hypothetical protein Acr_11g0012920 [Actinidia rufa]
MDQNLTTLSPVNMCLMAHTIKISTHPLNLVVTFSDNNGFDATTMLAIPKGSLLLWAQLSICPWHWGRFCNGEVCPYGQRCHFLHEGPARFRESCAISIGTTGSGIECKPLVHSSLNAKQNSQKPVFPKTRLCYKWEATGNCPFGTNCYFAHGHADISAVSAIVNKLSSSTLQGARTVEENSVKFMRIDVILKSLDYVVFNLMKFRSQTTEYGNVSTSKMIPTAATHASPSRTGNGTACEKQMQGKKCLFKWKGFEKISRIYADWIDDVPLVHS